jgi:hypothetical protein
MYIPSGQKFLAAGLALTGTFIKRTSPFPSILSPKLTKPHRKRPVSSGKVLEYIGGKYIDNDDNKRCTAPFLVYLDFKPKVWKTGNDTVEYKVTKCDKQED